MPFLGFIIQKRGVNEGTNENFDRAWDEYKNGFGDHDKEFWLGNDQIHELTKAGDKKLRVELEAWDGRTAWAEYDTFRWLLKIDFKKINIDTIHPELRERTRDTNSTSVATQAQLGTA